MSIAQAYTPPSPLVISMPHATPWPEGKRFAFTIFDDTDFATLDNVGPLYSVLEDLGLRTTKSVWPLRGTGKAVNPGQTCEDPEYLAWVQVLQAKGFEIGYHLARFNTSPRDETLRAMDAFRSWFGQDPATGANHSGCDEGMYWGSNRLSGVSRLVYNMLTRFQQHGRYRGHVSGDPLFWGDLCAERVRYFRNFVFPELNTLACCPDMPYRDPLRPYVNAWFASADGNDLHQFLRCLSEANQDRLEEEGGAAIVYTHLGKNFMDGGRPHPEFVRLLTRLAAKPGWFVPTSTLLDHLAAVRGVQTLTPARRRALEWRWIWGKIRLGGRT